MSKKRPYYPTPTPNSLVNHAVKHREFERGEKVGIEKGMMLTLAVVLNLLIEDYWVKTAYKRVPKFAEDVVNLIDAIQSGVVSVEECVDYVERVTGMKFNADWIKHTRDGKDIIGKLKNLKGE